MLGSFDEVSKGARVQKRWGLNKGQGSTTGDWKDGKRMGFSNKNKNKNNGGHVPVRVGNDLGPGSTSGSKIQIAVGSSSGSVIHWKDQIQGILMWRMEDEWRKAWVEWDASASRWVMTSTKWDWWMGWARTRNYLSVTGSNAIELSASATIWGIVDCCWPMVGA